nr:hypothetical protein [Pseudomonas sp. 7SR1]
MSSLPTSNQHLPNADDPWDERVLPILY